MIEMSVDKETVTTGGTKANSTPSLQLQQLSECTGSYNNASVTEVSLATSGIPDGASACPAGLASGIQKKQAGPADPHKQTENVRVRVSDKPLNTQNGLQQPKQQPQQQQQQQPQKLSKRRSTSTTGFKHPPSGKRRRRANSESDSVLPTNFLLGGNIFDPLNLNSLLDEEVNRALNAETPKSSPLPAKSRDPVEILIPRDITDPLNLNSGTTGSNFLVSPFKRRRHRHRHHGGGGGGGGGASAGASAGAGSVSAPHLDASDSEKAGDAHTISSLPSCSSAPASEAAPKGSGVQSGDAGTSLCEDEPKPSNGKVEAGLPAWTQPSQPRGPEDPCTVTGGPNQHSGRPRKRRRNSVKTEPTFAQSTPVGKPYTEDKSRGAAAGRNVQTFHSPVTGSRPGQGGRHQRKQQQQKMKFQYGNYSQYYGYRNPGFSEDPRFRVLRPEWFQGKEVLDLGCNTGQLTLCIAKKLRPARILGLDIDGALVHAARQNIRHYLSEMKAQEARRVAAAAAAAVAGGERPAGLEDKGENKGEEEENRTGREIQRDKPKEDKANVGEARGENGDAVGRLERECVSSTDPAAQGELCPASDSGQERRAEGAEHGDAEGAPVDHKCSFPVSLRISRGPIAAPPLPETPTMPPGDFPANVSFIKANYVLENDALLETQRPEYDIILCLSVTKWVHLNWGDSGLKRLFHRVYRHLRPGGRFILEPQPWDTYGKRKKLSDSIFRNYHGICLKPDQFSTYLVSEVGFTSYELIGTPKSSSKGFERPIYLFYK